MKNLAIFAITFCSATYTNAQLATDNKNVQTLGDTIPKTMFFIPLVGNVQCSSALYTYQFQQALMSFQIDSLVEQKTAPKTTLKSTEKTTNKNVYVVQKTTNTGGINQ